MYVDYIIDSIIKHHDKLVHKYYEIPPLLRYTGVVESPSSLSSVDHTRFSFGVENVGGSPWFGWFGVRLVSIVETEDLVSGSYDPPYFVWNKRFGITSISPGSAYSVSVDVPGVQVFNISKLGSHVKWNSIINTLPGVGSSWMKM
jgi:hypothetical protein